MTKTTEYPPSTISEDQLQRLMTGRRSLYPRQFTGEVVEDNVVLQLLRYANMAPNHKLTRPWRFIVYKDEALKELLDFKKQFYIDHTPKEKIQQKKIDSYDFKKKQTSHVIGIVMHRDPEERIPEMEEIAAVACAIQNIYLSLATFGLGGYWSTGKASFSQEARDYLDIKGKDKLMGFFYLGKISTQFPIVEKDSVDELITWKS